jgi:hypothetical protein
MTINAVGLSGRNYTLFVHPIGTEYRDVPGVYAFVKRGHDLNWLAVYIGETGSLYRRLCLELSQHHQLPAALREGATHLATMAVDGGLSAREGIETDLRRAISTPCNLQGNALAALFSR